MNTARTDAPARPRPRRRRAVLLVALLVLVALAWLAREPIRQRLVVSLLLGREAPSPELLEEVMENAKNAPALIQAAWDTRRVVQRQVAIRQMARPQYLTGPLPPGMETMLFAGAFDPDLSVRELALASLSARKHPALPALAAAQLDDADPEVRLMGLTHLRRVPAQVGLPLLYRHLDDPEPRVVAMELLAIGRWAGTNFGVRLSDVVAADPGATGDDARSVVQAGVDRARAWWARHAADYPAAAPEVPDAARAAVSPPPVADFALTGLDGRPRRLSDFRGRIVLINFWATWCTACAGEIATLSELQRRHPQGLVVLGISLDGVPNAHGIGEGERDAVPRGTPLAEPAGPSPDRVREQVARAVQTRGVSYTVLLDPGNTVGSRFNGGELPTTVVVDADGGLRRRFVGPRSLNALEAMIVAAGRPASGGRPAP